MALSPAKLPPFRAPGAYGRVPPTRCSCGAVLALLGTLGSSLAGAVAVSDGREAVVVTFVVAASGITALGVSAAFWALAAGIAVNTVVRVGRVRDTRSTDCAQPVSR